MSLAVLQNRWIGELGEARREQISKDLRQVSDSVSRGFGRELTRLGVAFRRGHLSEGGPIWGVYAQLFQEWKDVALHPGLAVAVYGGIQSAGGLPEIQRIDEDAPVVASNRLHALAMQCADFTSGRMRIGPGRTPIHRWSFAMLDGRPLMIRPVFSEEGPAASGASGEPMGYLIVELDKSYLRNHFLPSLGERYSGRISDSVFQLSILRGETGGETLFGPALADGQLPDRTSTLIRYRGFGLARPGSQTRQDGWRAWSAAPEISACRETDVWTLAVSHRSGSVDRAVAGYRARNLAISGGILALLALAAWMLVVTTRRAEHLAKLRMQFAAGVSHEFRTPLTVIRLLADNLSSGIVRGEREVADTGRTLLRESRRLSAMVEQVLDFASLQGKARRPEVGPLDIEEVIRNAERLAKPALKESGVSITTTVPAGLPRALGNPDMLSQCLQNLLGNAVKHSGKSPDVRIQAESGGTSAKPTVEVSVTDAGPGIAREDLPRIFDPFYQGGGNGNVKTPGVGLGLSLTKEMVESMGGSVLVDSCVGRGSRFTISLAAVVDGAIDEKRQANPVG